MKGENLMHHEIVTELNLNVLKLRTGQDYFEQVFINNT